MTDRLVSGQERVGKTLGSRWRVDCLIGEGGMASVYAATDASGHRVALKVLHPELSASAEVRRRFLREGYIANKVGHLGAVQVFDDGIDESGSVFLVMELLEGETVASRLDRLGMLSVQEALSITARLLDVLIAAHSHDIIHRDLKPDNVFLTHDGQVKVLDFGIAQLRELSSRDTATRTGAMMGTPAFMPPEQALGRTREIDVRTDLWAVGAALFRMTTGCNVHQGESANEVMVRAATRKAPAFAAVAVDAPEALAAFIDRSLSFAREGRWPDARTMKHALEQVSNQLPVAPPLLLQPSAALLSGNVADSTDLSTVTKQQTTTPSSSRHTLAAIVAIAIGAAAAALVIIAMVMLLPNTTRPSPAVAPSPSTVVAPSSPPPATASSSAEPVASSSTAPSASSARPPPTRSAPPVILDDGLNRRH